MRSAVFLDRDGTVVRNVHHGADPLRGEVLDGAVAALRAFQHFGYRLVVVTNQSGVGRGLFTAEEARQAARYLCAWLGRQGVRLDGFYLCPHRPHESRSAACGCRKPEPGMLLAAAEELAIDLSRSWMIGDTMADCLAGRTAGCRAILLVGADARHDLRPTAGCEPLLARNLPHAAAILLTRDGHLDSLAVEAKELSRAGPPPRVPLAVGEASPLPGGLDVEQARRDAARLLAQIDRSATRQDRPARSRE